MTKLGRGTASSELSGKMNSGIFYRAPSAFSSGFFQFSYYSDSDITNHSPNVMELNNRKAAELSRIEIGKSDVGIVKLFLKQLSEDTNLPITRA